jgi:hypothetical protein
MYMLCMCSHEPQVCMHYVYVMYLLSRTTGVYALCICVKICIDSIYFVPHVYGHYVSAFRRYVYVMYVLSRTTGMGRLCVTGMGRLCVCAPQVSMHYLSALANSISICHVCLCVYVMCVCVSQACIHFVSVYHRYVSALTNSICICVCVSQVCIHCVSVCLCTTGM